MRYELDKQNITTTNDEILKLYDLPYLFQEAQRHRSLDEQYYMFGMHIIINPISAGINFKINTPRWSSLELGVDFLEMIEIISNMIQQPNLVELEYNNRIYAHNVQIDAKDIMKHLETKPSNIFDIEKLREIKNQYYCDMEYETKK